MKRIIAALLIITALFTLASCGSTYKVESEKDALKVYSCSCNNMLGLEKIAIFKNRVVTVFDKKTMDKSRYTMQAKEIAKSGQFSTSAVLTGNANYECKSGFYIDGSKYIVLSVFNFNGDNKIIDPALGITVDHIDIENWTIYLNNGSFKLSCSEAVPDAYMVYTQEYNAGTKKWSKINQSASSNTILPAA